MLLCKLKQALKKIILPNTEACFRVCPPGVLEHFTKKYSITLIVLIY